jgi:hypothetical protein
MKNEPVAYVTGVKQFDPVMVDTVLKVGTPLYTHPADLTDEEILATFNPKFMCDLDDSDVIDFGRAILRKAQEK